MGIPSQSAQELAIFIDRIWGF